MQTATVPFCFRPARSSRVALVLSLAAALGCGGSQGLEGDGANPSSSGGSASSTNPVTAPAPSQSSSSSDGGRAPVSAPPASTPPVSSPASNESNTTPASTDVTGVGAACEEFGSSDACGACVCSECGAQLDTCANTPGCPAILACVRENGCSGTDCFCGDARLPRCFDGGGDGPCKSVVLAAPGGREPTLDDPSGGPASDAALLVGACADDDDVCADVCDVGL